MFSDYLRIGQSRAQGRLRSYARALLARASLALVGRAMIFMGDFRLARAGRTLGTIADLHEREIMLR